MYMAVVLAATHMYLRMLWSYNITAAAVYSCIQSHTCPMTNVWNAHPANDLFVCFTKVMTLATPSSPSTAKAAYSHQLIDWTEKTFHSTI